MKPLVLRLYAAMLYLYPKAFRQRYAAEMLQAARLEAAERRSSLRFAASLLWDTLQSVLRETWHAPSPMLSVALFGLIALLYGGSLFSTSVVRQQVLRHEADAQPAALAADYARLAASPNSLATALQRISHHQVQEISSAAWLSSQRAFVALYDSSGHAIAADATLHGLLPQPPSGIFQTIRTRGQFKVTWQPQPGVRVALTGLPIASGGFILSGQSLIPSEAQTAHNNRMFLAAAAVSLLPTLVMLAIVYFRPRPLPA